MYRVKLTFKNCYTKVIKCIDNIHLRNIMNFVDTVGIKAEVIV